MDDLNSQNQYLLYMGFAGLAIAINIIFQIITKEILLLLLYDFAVNMFSVGNTSFEYWFLIALATGTLSGFIFKFIIDKFIVFGETAETLTKEETGKQLSLYFSFAILTTAIFWGTLVALESMRLQEYSIPLEKDFQTL